MSIIEMMHEKLKDEKIKEQRAKISELQAVIDRLAKWSRDNPRGRIYPAGKRQKDMDGELIKIEELAKQHASED